MTETFTTATSNLFANPFSNQKAWLIFLAIGCWGWPLTTAARQKPVAPESATVIVETGIDHSGDRQSDDLLPDAPSPSNAQIAQLMSDLASPHFLVRQSASQRLWAWGQHDQKLLKRIAQSPDAEVSQRANSLLEMLNLGVDAETTPEIAHVILFFNQAGNELKTKILHWLVLHRQLEQAYRLIAQIENSDERLEIYRDVIELNTLLLQLAKKEQWEEFKFLVNHPLTLEYDTMIGVYFRHASGTLDELVRQQLSDLQTRTTDGQNVGDQERLRLVALLRFQQQYDQAQIQAEKITDANLRANLKRQILMEQGDWQTLAENMVLPEENFDPEKGLFAFNQSQQILIENFNGDPDSVQSGINRLIKKADELTEKGLEEEARQIKHNVVCLALAVNDWSLVEAHLDRTNRLEIYDLFTLFNRIEAAHQSIELGDTFDQRRVWMLRRIRNLKSLEHKIKRLEENRGDSDEANEDLDRTWNLCVDVVQELASLGFTAEALYHYQNLFDSLGENTYDKRAVILRGIIFLCEYETAWKLIDEGIEPKHRAQLHVALFPEKQESAKFWYNLLESRYPDVLLRLRVVASMINSPLGDPDFDFDTEVSLIEGQSDSANGKLEFEIARLKKFRGQLEPFRLELVHSADLGYAAANRQLAINLLNDHQYAEAAKRYAEPASQTRSVDNAMLAAEAFENLGQDEEAALLETVAFVFWHEHYRSESIITWFTHYDRAHRVSDFVRLYVCAPGSTQVSNEAYRQSLASTLSAKTSASNSADRANHWRMAMLNLASNTRYGQPFEIWIELSRNIMLAHVETEIAAGRYEAAKQALDDWLKFRPGDTEVGEKFVKAFDDAGETELADQLFHQLSDRFFEIFKKYPDSSLHHNNYAWVCASSQRAMEFVKRHCQIALDARPTNPSYLDTLAEACFVLGDTEEAIALIRQCIALSPQKPHYQNQFHRFQEGRR